MPVTLGDDEIGLVAQSLAHDAFVRWVVPSNAHTHPDVSTNERLGTPLQAPARCFDKRSDIVRQSASVVGETARDLRVQQAVKDIELRARATRKLRAFHEGQVV